MKWGSFAEAFNKPGSRNIRLALSLLFIMLATVIIMTLFQVAKVFLDPDIMLWESHIYTILFTGIIAPLVALFVLLRFEGLYGKLSEDNEQRKRAEETLTNSEARYRALFEYASDAILIADVDTGVIIDCNPNAEKLMGRSRSEIIGLHQTDLHPPKEAEKYRKLFQQHAREGGIINLEMDVLHRDGRRIPVIISARAIVFNGKKIMMGHFLDITERNRVEEALQFERLQLLSIFDSIDEVIYVADPYTYEILYANKAMQDKFGKSLTGGICYREIQDKDAPCEFCTNDIILRNKGEPYRWEFHNPTVNKDFGIVDRIIKWPDGRDVRFEIALDITERKRAEKALWESEAMLRQIIDTSPIPMVVYREEENYRINKKFIEAFGYTKEDIPSIDDWWPLAYPDEAYREFVKNRWYAAVDDAVKNKTSIAPQEATVTCKDGSKKDVLAFFSSIGDMNLAILQDITERKRAEEELKAAKQQAELYLDLMGHDINNLHQVALGYLELARDMPDGEGQAMFLDKPVEVLQRSAKLISNVRKLQKLHDGMFQDRDVDVCEVLSDVQREFGAAPNKRVTLNINGYERCFIRANELLHDVFANLVSNAIKHTGDRADIVVDLDVVNDDVGRYCRVVVEDDGPGIPDDFKATIFNRVLKGTAKAKGMGLGLYLVKSLVDSYGGRVWVEDRVPGDHTKGARFVVMLPAVEK